MDICDRHMNDWPLYLRRSYNYSSMDLYLYVLTNPTVPNPDAMRDTDVP